MKFLNNVRTLNKIARRYFTTNSFDAATTQLGLIIGAFSVSFDNIYILAAGLGAAVAMGVSGISSVYLSESAEIKRKLRDFELAMAKDLGDSQVGHDARMLPIVTAVIAGIAPFLTSLCILLPFVLSVKSIIDIYTAYYISLVIALTILFALGLFMGRIAKENIIWYAFKTLGIGIMTILLVFGVSRIIM